ncbi:hypothetical protein J6590_013634 [Homalodisca vitripennis]|nr:hypothetical protein J6590_013634 [Homalodisca vitripennis]
MFTIGKAFSLNINMALSLCTPDKNGPAGFPEVIQPPGLSEARKNYLYKNIKPYCKDEFKDLMCPAKSRCPKELEKNQGDTENPEPTRTLDVAGPSRPAKRKRTL